MDTALRKAVQDRILNGMIGGISDSTGGGWKVLILDTVTTRILSSAVKMGDIMDCNVSVVEDLHKVRQPLPLVAVYFIAPTSENISRLLQDFEDSKPPYPSVHIFFSSQVRPRYIDKIKGCPPLLKVIKTLKETNLEYLMVDSRTVITDIPEHPDAHTTSALIRFMGQASDSRARDSEITTIASRLSTLFSTLKDYPAIRYFLPPPPQPTDPPGAHGRSTLTQRLAMALLEKLDKMQQGGALPSRETCDLIILDRSYDPLAPIIHEWTYETMVYDLLHMEGSMYKYEVETTSSKGEGKSSSKSETKESSVDERDPLWLELRHMFVAEVYAAIATRFKEFQTKNKAAKAAGSSKASANDMSLGSIRSLITALPQYHDILSRMSLHIQVCAELKTVTNQRLLTEVGELEQDLVFGEKTSKDLLSFVAAHQHDLDPNDKIRLFMCYVATHPERLDLAKRQEWMKLAGLSIEDMDAICNLAYLGVPVMKMPEKSGFFGSKKDKKGKTLRQPRHEEDGYALFRFEPLLRDILTDLNSNKLSPEQYPFIRAPSSDPSGGFGKGPEPSAASARTRPGGLNWAKRGAGTDGSQSGSGTGGRRVIVYVLGGAVRSEMRLVHQLSQQLGRDIILASTAIETPHDFVEYLKEIGSPAAAEV